jgi:hypothetical protein
MFYTYVTNAGTFRLERQEFTESAWRLTFNGSFIDCYASRDEAVRRIPRVGGLLGLQDAVLLPPPTLAAWQIHWSKTFPGEASELWLHRQYLKGLAQRPPAGAPRRNNRRGH